MTREEIIDRIRKVQALAKQGTEGERQSAEARLKEMTEKYGISLEELDENKEQLFYYHLHGERKYELFAQVAATRGCTRFVFIGPEHNNKHAQYVRNHAYDRPRGSNVAMVCTMIQYIEITTAYEVYQKSLDDHYESLFYAFLGTNNLFYGKADPSKQLTPEEEKMLRRAQLMSFGVEQSQVHKQIGTGE